MIASGGRLGGGAADASNLITSLDPLSWMTPVILIAHVPITQAAFGDDCQPSLSRQ
jgi:hypothetical protein